jgi:hypothetical protein
MAHRRHPPLIREALAYLAAQAIADASGKHLRFAGPLLTDVNAL